VRAADKSGGPRADELRSAVQHISIAEPSRAGNHGMSPRARFDWPCLMQTLTEVSTEYNTSLLA